MTKDEYNKLVDENPLGLSQETLDALKETPRPDLDQVAYEPEQPLLPAVDPYRPLGRRAGPNLGSAKQ